MIPAMTSEKERAAHPKLSYIILAVSALLSVGHVYALLGSGLFLKSSGMQGVQPISLAEAKRRIAPHKATYEVRMVAKHTAAQVINVSGTITYELNNTCEGWDTTHSVDLLYEYADTAPIPLKSVYKTFEPYDELSMTFLARETSNGKALSEYRGIAKTGGVDMVNFTYPETYQQDLPSHVLLPMEHARALLSYIDQGKPYFSVPIFDGSDKEGETYVSTFIGSDVTLSAERLSKIEGDTSLLKGPAHNARMAFYLYEDKDNMQPSHELDAVFFNNVVISDMRAHYKDFTLEQTLRSIEAVEGGCKGV